ncbi:hypothetical protein PDE_03237 [Penicillium oxalicum 114-2]|uniref:Bromo domain-containing protein n=1 Tax=Penicillium oxalicum (strain 114-2 / CGMCC 5302) TaxID=933388 RepID=S7ZHX6_PENO1|nr:hypothetical protein PDE_03237 [Penicillium oxalicum 114-2]
MPPLSAYTPFESLLFFQTLAASNEPPANFTSISKFLSNNSLVRENVAFSADRLSPEALEDLYASLLRDGFDRDAISTGANGRIPDNYGSNNFKKRKISSPRPDGLPDGPSHATLIPDLVARLYARYKELVTKEIRDEEKRYNAIKGEIEQLQKEGQQGATAARPAAAVAQAPETERKQSMDVDVKKEPARQERPDQATRIPDLAESRQPLPQAAPADQPRPPGVSYPPSLPSAPSAPAALPNPQRPQTQVQPTMTAISQPSSLQGIRSQDSSPHPYQQPLAPRTQLPGPSTPVATRVVPPHPSQVAPQAHGPGTPLPSSVKTTVPLSTSQQPTPTQSSFQQWQLEAPPHSPYSAVSPATTVPATAPVTKQPGLPPQGPARAPSRASQLSAAPSTPGPTTPLVQTPAPGGFSRNSQTPSVVIPAYPEGKGSRPRLSIDTPGSSTPWKRTPRLSIPESPASPPRPRPEDVSPISERAPSPGAMDISPPREKKTTRRSQAAAADSKATPSIKIEKASSARRNRAISSASIQSRGRSVASREVSREPSRSATGHKESATAVEDQTPKARPKRKRGASESLDNEPIVFEQPRIDSTKYVLCTRGFHRTAAPIMNDVTTHKLASIFAKPISERDAPGYHDLIYRPQDLKSIKSAVHQGSKSVAVATEAVSTPAGDGESPAPGIGTPSKNNMLMLQKTEDLVPPKAIVNSAQLEKELIRMFANAIMYNPIPARGFGPAFPMMNERGSRESTQSGDGDEGGIIQDSLEMFEDVEQAVTHWRQAERTAERNADDLANKNVLFLRRGSVSDFNTDSADDAKG